VFLVFYISPYINTYLIYGIITKMSIIKQLGEAGITFRLKRINDKLAQEILTRFRDCGLEVEPSGLPILYFIKEEKNCSVQDISLALGISHPAAVQFVQNLEKRKLIKTSTDQSDKRKKIIDLTDKGYNIIGKMLPLQNDIEAAFRKLNEEIELDLLTALDKIEKALSREAFYNRLLTSYKEKAIKQVEILSYNNKLKSFFKDLNYEWLEKYFEIEEIDKKILNDPENEIIRKGGEIFFARIDGEIIGTCAALKTDKNTYELAKMAVTKKSQGKQAGRKLALAVIGFAWSKKAKYVTLLTSNKLVEAVNLYKSLGFQIINENEHNEYKRKVFRMRLDL
jgi:DNA-binding MarR family transcriptional regulator/predicted GNAT family N-acyltransferase